MYNIILFDLDGTITDSAEAIIKSTEYALRQVGITDIDHQKIHKSIGPPLNERFHKFYGLDDMKTFQAIKYYRKRYEKAGIEESKLYDGIKETIIKLHKKGKTLYIATSKLAYFAQKILEDFELKEYFTEIVGATIDFSLSKKNDIVAEIIQKHPQEPKNSFAMVGDTEFDILAANEHGIDSIHAAYGYGNPEKIKDTKPTHIANSTKDLSAILLEDHNQGSLF